MGVGQACLASLSLPHTCCGGILCYSGGSWEIFPFKSNRRLEIAFLNSLYNVNRNYVSRMTRIRNLVIPYWLMANPHYERAHIFDQNNSEFRDHRRSRINIYLHLYIWFVETYQTVEPRA